MDLVNFLLIYDKTIVYEKNDIDKGKTPPLIYEICSCLREAFCLSYAIRKNNNIYLYFKDTSGLIKFQGNKLKYLGPDERSQALLLLKAQNKIKVAKLQESNGWIKSTPGIYVKKCKNILSFVQSEMCDPNEVKLFIIHNQLASTLIELQNFKNNNFFYTPKTLSFIMSKNDLNLEVFLELTNYHEINVIRFGSVKKLNDQILLLNFIKDRISEVRVKNNIT
ncbi:MAG: hypothetical protein GF353_19840 [Candidatus Lokiarchaeota archaeon]|nr:hypothetical protein [Candidatus Lokiarchaeota archaeon]